MTADLGYWLVCRMVLAATLLALASMTGLAYDATPLPADAGLLDPASFNPDGTINLEVDYGG